ncbi:MAG: cobalamin-independent methionine synthase II family protein [Vicinamibacterales bacterium]
MLLPTEPIGSIPRPPELLEALAEHAAGRLPAPALEAAYDRAIVETIRLFEATGSPVITDGEQRKFHNFATYAVDGLPNMAPDGFRLQFVRHHQRFPRLTAGPFRYCRHADTFVEKAVALTDRPIKQAVIAPSALSLMYPAEDLPDYPRDRYLDAVLDEHVHEVRACLRKGAHSVQIDFTEARLSLKLDPSGELLANFIRLNNLALERFTPDERRRIGVHTCPGGDRDSTHSAEVDYAGLLPSLFELKAGNFFIALAGERDRVGVLEMIRDTLRPWQRAFVGVVNVLDPRVDTAEEVCDRVLEAAEYIPFEQLGTTDDCGYAPFCDDVSTTRDVAFAKIRARVDGTAMAAARLARQPVGAGRA